jgi:hypothetical protein
MDFNGSLRRRARKQLMESRLKMSHEIISPQTTVNPASLQKVTANPIYEDSCKTFRKAVTI